MGAETRGPLSATAAAALLTLPLVLAAAGCGGSEATATATAEAARSAGLACRGDERPMLVAELFFGRTLPGDGVVSEAAWGAFVREVLTPTFPDGLTVLDASGQWLNPRTGQTTEAEPTKLVVLAIEETDTADARLDAVRNAYRQRFAQQSVGLIRQRTCAAF
ncbi:MAG TPA: DUF3574 domain-containing protein [Stellaceae bacterium]